MPWLSLIPISSHDGSRKELGVDHHTAHPRRMRITSQEDHTAAGCSSVTGGRAGGRQQDSAALLLAPLLGAGPKTSLIKSARKKSQSSGASRKGD